MIAIWRRKDMDTSPFGTLSKLQLFYLVITLWELKFIGLLNLKLPENMLDIVVTIILFQYQYKKFIEVYFIRHYPKITVVCYLLF